MKRAPICIATFTCAGDNEGCAFNSSATPPLTTPVAILVPLKRMYAFLPEPAMCHWR